jgi:hypothetical protein
VKPTGSGTGKWDQAGRQEKPENPLARAPRARVCYICGRQYMVHSFPIHEKQCIKLFEDREALKPKKERKPVPSDPALTMSMGMGMGNKEKVSFDVEFVGGGDAFGGGNINNRNELDTLDAINAASQASYSGATLKKCKNCFRTFLPEQLSRHNRLCTSSRPFKKVGESIQAPGLGQAGRDNDPYVYVEKKSSVASANIKASNRSGSSSGSGYNAAGNRGMSKEKSYDTNWRNKSNSFRAAISYARRVAQAEYLAKKTGQHIDNFLVPPTAEEQKHLNAGNEENGSNVLCTTCGRRFNSKAAERHIPLCKNIQNKPTRLIRGTGKGIGTRAVDTSSSNLNLSPSAPLDTPAEGERNRHSLGNTYGGRKLYSTTAVVTKDTGLATFESKRLGNNQRVHPALHRDDKLAPSIGGRLGSRGATLTSSYNEYPYGDSVTERTSSSAGTSFKPKPVVGPSVSGLSAAARQTEKRLDAAMATASGAKLKQLMQMKKQVEQQVLESKRLTMVAKQGLGVVRQVQSRRK